MGVSRMLIIICLCILQNQFLGKFIVGNEIYYKETAIYPNVIDG